MRRLPLLLFAAIVLVVTTAGRANASPIVWTLVGATFDDGATLSGTFTIESTTSVLTNWNLTTTAGTALPGFIYNTSTSSLFGMNIFGPNSFVVNANNAFLSPYLNLRFTGSFAVPGTISLDTSGVGIGSWECNNCFPDRALVAGTATTQAAVPEPTSLVLLSTGLAAAVMARRRMKKRE